MFGRSAFNRYYYSVYLSVRKMVNTGHPEIKQLKHSDLPDILVGKVYEKIKQETTKLKKRNVLSDGQAGRLERSSKQALNELASILREGYHVRVVADYKPDVIAVICDGHVVLDEKTSDAACQWGRRAERSIGVVRSVWRQLGIDT